MQKFFLYFLSFSFLILFFLTATISAQDTEAAALSPDGDEYCWGLNFMWGKDFTVGKQKIDEFNYDLSTPESEHITGFGVDYYPNIRSSFYFLGSLGIGSDKTENTGGTQDYSSTEIGAKLGYNYYPLGMERQVYYSIGPWASFVSYSESQTNTPTTGTETKDEYSASRLGFGINASAYVRPWKDLQWEFYAGYNLGAFITPESTITQTSEGTSIESKGPSSFHFQDCGGFVGTRFKF
jgi:hypothetical protein